MRLAVALPVLLVLFGLPLAACGGARTTPILGAGPGRPGDPRVFDDAIRGAQGAGYQPQRVDAAAGRFVITSRSDRTGLTRFEVQCYREGTVSLVPMGEGITHEGDSVLLSGRVRSEYLRLASAINASIEVRP